MNTYTTAYGKTVELSDYVVNTLAQVGDPAQIVRKDSMRLAEGIDPEQLRRECLDGAEDDHIIAGWNEYVDALAAVGASCYVYDAFEPGDRVRAGEGDDETLANHVEKAAQLPKMLRHVCGAFTGTKRPEAPKPVVVVSATIT